MLYIRLHTLRANPSSHSDQTWARKEQTAGPETRSEARNRKKCGRNREALRDMVCREAMCEGAHAKDLLLERGAVQLWSALLLRIRCISNPAEPRRPSRARQADNNHTQQLGAGRLGNGGWLACFRCDEKQPPRIGGNLRNKQCTCLRKPPNPPAEAHGWRRHALLLPLCMSTRSPQQGAAMGC